MEKRNQGLSLFWLLAIINLTTSTMASETELPNYQEAVFIESMELTTETTEEITRTKRQQLLNIKRAMLHSHNFYFLYITDPLSILRNHLDPLHFFRPSPKTKEPLITNHLIGQLLEQTEDGEGIYEQIHATVGEAFMIEEEEARKAEFEAEGIVAPEDLMSFRIASGNTFIECAKNAKRTLFLEQKLLDSQKEDSSNPTNHAIPNLLELEIDEREDKLDKVLNQALQPVFSNYPDGVVPFFLGLWHPTFRTHTILIAAKNYGAINQLIQSSKSRLSQRQYDMSLQLSRIFRANNGKGSKKAETNQAICHLLHKLNHYCDRFPFSEAALCRPSSNYDQEDFRLSNDLIVLPEDVISARETTDGYHIKTALSELLTAVQGMTTLLYSSDGYAVAENLKRTNFSNWLQQCLDGHTMQHICLFSLYGSEMALLTFMSLLSQIRMGPSHLLDPDGYKDFQISHVKQSNNELLVSKNRQQIVKLARCIYSKRITAWQIASRFVQQFSDEIRKILRVILSELERLSFEDKHHINELLEMSNQAQSIVTTLNPRNGFALAFESSSCSPVQVFSYQTYANHGNPASWSFWGVKTDPHSVAQVGEILDELYMALFENTPYAEYQEELFTFSYEWRKQMSAILEETDGLIWEIKAKLNHQLFLNHMGTIRQTHDL